jgi:hypothetical protein
VLDGAVVVERCADGDALHVDYHNALHALV